MAWVRKIVNGRERLVFVSGAVPKKTTPTPTKASQVPGYVPPKPKTTAPISVTGKTKPKEPAVPTPIVRATSGATLPAPSPLVRSTGGYSQGQLASAALPSIPQARVAVSPLVRQTAGGVTPTSAALPSVSPERVKSASLARLTAGGVTARPAAGLPPVPSTQLAGQPLVRLTAAGVTPRSPGRIWQSPDVAIASGNIYTGPIGQVGPNEFVVSDLSDVAHIARAVPGANIFYADPKMPGPLRGVSGIAAWQPILLKFLLGHDLPQSAIDSLVRLGLLEAEDGGLFPLPTGDGIGTNGAGGGTRFRTETGTGKPSSRAISMGLVNWRV